MICLRYLDALHVVLVLDLHSHKLPQLAHEHGENANEDKRSYRAMAPLSVSFDVFLEVIVIIISLVMAMVILSLVVTFRRVHLWGLVRTFLVDVLVALKMSSLRPSMAVVVHKFFDEFLSFVIEDFPGSVFLILVPGVDEGVGSILSNFLEELVPLTFLNIVEPVLKLFWLQEGGESLPVLYVKPLE